MFDDNQFDQWAKSMLDDVQVDVPEHIWEHVSAGLDRAAEKRKTVVLYWRRAASVIATAAAVLAAFLYLGHGETGVDPYATEDGLVAVIPSESGEIETGRFLAQAKEITYNVRTKEGHECNRAMQNADQPVREADVTKPGKEATELETEVSKQEKEIKAPAEEAVRFPEDWEEEDVKDRNKAKASIVLSGTAGSNNPKSNNVSGPLRLPQMLSKCPQTGINQTSTESTYGIPISAGVGVKIDFTPRWALGIGINYTLLTRDFYGSYTLVGDNGDILLYQQSDIRNIQHYIGLPINAYYNIVSHEKIRFYTYAGGTVEKCLSNRYHVLNPSLVHKEKAEGVQLSVNAGIGAEFILGKHLGIYIDPSIRYYFHNSQPQSIRTAQPLMLGFEVGLRVNL